MNLKGLYDKQDQHFVAIDCIIFGFDQNELKILLIKRGFQPEEGKWSLMGGFVKADESVEEGAQRILFTLTGLTEIYMEQLFAYGSIDRDPVARTISIAYYALIRTDFFDKELAKKYNAKWFKMSQLPPLIFDHQEMVNKALARLKRKTSTQPIGFELLPEKFTIPQLRSLYETINDKIYDHRNFNKKIKSMTWLVKLLEKDKSSSRKGAYFFRFDKERYEQALAEGILFDL